MNLTQHAELLRFLDHKQRMQCGNFAVKKLYIRAKEVVATRILPNVANAKTFLDNNIPFMIREDLWKFLQVIEDLTDIYFLTNYIHYASFHEQKAANPKYTLLQFREVEFARLKLYPAAAKIDTILRNYERPFGQQKTLYLPSDFHHQPNSATTAIVTADTKETEFNGEEVLPVGHENTLPRSRRTI